MDHLLPDTDGLITVSWKGINPKTFFNAYLGLFPFFSLSLSTCIQQMLCFICKTGKCEAETWLCSVEGWTKQSLESLLVLFLVILLLRSGCW